MKGKRFIKPLLFVLIAVFSVCAAGRLLRPKYMDEIWEGRLIGDYYSQVGDHQVLFVGDCEVYENFSPVTLWREYGFTSYIRGSAQQLIWQSYYLMREMLKKEKPDAVVFNVLSMKYGEPQSEAYNRMSIDGMRLSVDKIGSVRASMTEEEDFASYLFPILRYHSRWNELKKEDFKYYFGTPSTFHSGYLMRTDVRAAENVPAPIPLDNYDFSPTAWEYLDKMRTLCEDSGVALVLIKAPSLYPAWYDEWDAQIKDYAQKHGLVYYNFLEDVDATGLDYTRDTYDSGLHLNVFGAEKLSVRFGERLREDLELSDLRGLDAARDERWEKICAAYDQMKQEQLTELESVGYLKSFGGRAPASKETEEK